MNCRNWLSIENECVNECFTFNGICENFKLDEKTGVIMSNEKSNKSVVNIVGDGRLSSEVLASVTSAEVPSSGVGVDDSGSVGFNLGDVGSLSNCINNDKEPDASIVFNFKRLAKKTCLFVSENNTDLVTELKVKRDFFGGDVPAKLEIKIFND